MIKTNESNYLIHANNIDECIEVLKERAREHNLFHTEILPQSDTLICLNPFKQIPELFSTNLMTQYFLKQTDTPHLFKYASFALDSILDNNTHISQAILVTGESGSGKTSSINYLVSYFSHITHQSNQEYSIEKMLLHTNPILEAFGNASTIQNENSSRFGKYIELRLNSFKKQLKLKSVKITTYLLEKTRATRVPDKSIERNFHIFYQLLAGASQTERHEWHLNEQMNNHFQPNEIDLSNWLLVKDAFKYLHISNYNDIFKLISFISHLLVSDLDLNVASLLLGFDDLTSLDKYLTFQELNVASTMVKRLCSLAETRLRRDALIKFIYVNLFKWLVNELNKKFSILQNSCESKVNLLNESKYIGLLDIYGFENLNSNSFEQLCINYANEKIHQIFVDSHLKSVREECLNELVEWTPINCDNEDLLSQLESSSSQRGLFVILNEECMLRRDITSRRSSEKTTASLIDKILSAGHKRLCETKPFRNLCFTIKHYAGDVDYKIDEFIEKNKDQIPDDLMRFLSKSKNKFLNEIILNNNQNNTNTNKKKTVLDKFKLNLNALIHKLKETHIYYVRCIRPNKLKLADDYDNDLIRKQLDACGLSALIDLDKRFAFRHKISFSNFCKIYSPLLIKSNIKCNQKNDSIRLAKTIINLVDKNKQENYRIGKSKIFLNDDLYDKLNSKLEQTQSKSATKIQSVWRMHVKRTDFIRKRKSIIVVQNWFRKLPHRIRNKQSSNFLKVRPCPSSTSTTSTITLYSCTSNE